LDVSTNTLTTTTTIEAKQQIHVRLRQLIRVNRPDSFVTHFRQIFLIKDQEKVCGFFSKGEGRIWLSSHWYAASFYAVISIKVKEGVPNTKVILSSRMNSFGILLVVLLNAILLWFVTSYFILPPIVSNGWIGVRYLAAAIFMGCFNFVPWINYRTTKLALMKEIEEKLIDWC